MSDQAVNGFLETEIGPIPDGWGVAKLGEVVALSKDRANPAELNDARYVGLEHMDTGSPRLSRWGISSEVRSTKNRFYPGEILYGKLRPYLRKTVLADFEGICSTDILVLRASSNTTGNWLLHLLHTDAFVNHAISTTGGTNLPRTSWTALRDYRFLLPPLPEQRRIAHVLSTIQRAIQTQDAVIAATRELKRSLMHRLFTYGPYAEPLPTKVTEIGEVPDKWDVVRMGDVARIGNGSTPNRGNHSYWIDGTIPWLTSTKVHDHKIRQADEFVTEVAKRECHLPTVPKGSIVVAITGQGKTLGNAALTTFDTTINQHLAYVTLQQDKVSPEFVLGYLQRQYQDLRQAGRAGGSTKAALTCGLLKLYLLPVAPRHEQQLVAEFLSVVDTKIVVEQDRKTVLETLFKSMLNQLMTGRMRVP